MKNLIILLSVILIAIGYFTYDSYKDTKNKNSNYEIYKQNFNKLNFILDSIENIKYPISQQKVIVESGAVIYPYLVSFIIHTWSENNLLVNVKNSWEVVNIHESNIKFKFDSSENIPYIKLKYNNRESYKEIVELSNSDADEIQQSIKNLLENNTIFDFFDTEITLYSKYGKDLEKYYPPVNVSKN
jgi:hypothetical protein